jgi:hypothetical protein
VRRASERTPFLPTEVNTQRALSDKSEPDQVLYFASHAPYTKSAHDSPHSIADADRSTCCYASCLCCWLRLHLCCFAAPCAHKDDRSCHPREVQGARRTHAGGQALCCAPLAQSRPHPQSIRIRSTSQTQCTPPQRKPVARPRSSWTRRSRGTCSSTRPRARNPLPRRRRRFCTRDSRTAARGTLSRHHCWTVRRKVCRTSGSRRGAVCH